MSTFRGKRTVVVARLKNGGEQQNRRQGNKPGATAAGGMADKSYHARNLLCALWKRKRYVITITLTDL